MGAQVSVQTNLRMGAGRLCDVYGEPDFIVLLRPMRAGLHGLAPIDAIRFAWMMVRAPSNS